MQDDRGMIYPEAQFLPICEFVELKKQVSSPQIKWLDRHMITVTDISIWKVRKFQEKMKHYSLSLSFSVQIGIVSAGIKFSKIL